MGLPWHELTISNCTTKLHIFDKRIVRFLRYSTLPPWYDTFSSYLSTLHVNFSWLNWIFCETIDNYSVFSLISSLKYCCINALHYPVKLCNIVVLYELSGLLVYNPGHIILALFNNLSQVRIATSKTILDI